MNRRKSIRILTLGAVAAGTLLESCKPKASTVDHSMDAMGMHHRVGGEAYPLSVYDEGLQKASYFTSYELSQLAVLSDRIIPEDSHSGGASQAGVPAFIEFMAKDQPSLQIPLRGGLRWIDLFANRAYQQPFIQCSFEQQTSLLDQIAYPLSAQPTMSQGVSFFSLLRNLTATGFFSSKLGVHDLGYVGNKANIWDGAPAEVLQSLGLAYDPRWVNQYVKAADRSSPMTF